MQVSHHRVTAAFRQIRQRFQTRLDGPDDVRVFSCGLVVRGFDIDEGLPMDRGKAVDGTELETDVLPPAAPTGGTP